MDLLKYLKENSGIVESVEDQCMKIASRKGDVAMMEHLMNRGINIMPYHIQLIENSVKYAHFPALKLLINSGLNNKSCIDKALETTPLCIDDSIKLEIVEYLIENYEDQIDTSCFFMTVCQSDDVQILNFLIENYFSIFDKEYLRTIMSFFEFDKEINDKLKSVGMI